MSVMIFVRLFNSKVSYIILDENNSTKLRPVIFIVTLDIENTN